jgi:protein-tyrosine phosphatase
MPPSPNTPPLPDTYWVRTGQLLAGAHPFGEDPVDAHNRLATLREAGIDSFLDLTEASEAPVYRRLLPRRADYQRFAIPDHGVPNEVEQMRQIQSRIQQALAADRRLYVHCRAGIGRTGLTIGCFLVEQGLDGDAALRELNRLWQCSSTAEAWPRIPETEAQALYVQNWASFKQRD